MKKLLAILILLPSMAFGWQPTKPINVIFPNGPGAGNEISFFFVADIVTKKTGVTFNREHRPGVDGNIALNHFNTVPNDGYTIAVPACQSNWVTAEIWYPNSVKYDAMALEPVANIARSPLAFFAHPSSKVNTPEDLVKEILDKKRPINFAIGGGGHRLALEYLVEKIGVTDDKVVTTMYKGPAQALIDVIGGHVEFGITPIAVGNPHVQSGKLKLIGIANEKPLYGLEKARLMQDVAPGLHIHGCWNIVLPKGTPEDIQQWYKDNFIPAIRSKEAEVKFRENMMFITPEWHSPEGVRTAMTRMRQIWQPIAKKIKPE
jgi:tripartite-type tricarboxylate transporter receptor subunit TctC